MAPFPLPLADLLTKFGQLAVYFVIGLGFGIALEISGFGNSKKLAGQFYFKELTVLKVMFTAIVTAMVLIFAATGLGLLDYNAIWVNPTYLWPGIVGGLIMGVGFIIGGFCPGTSLVGMMTGKLDGLFFVLGGLFGIFLFGETVGLYDDFYNSSYYGRLTLQEWLDVPTGVVVLGVVLMALFMFWGGEHLERIFGGRDLKAEPKVRYAGAGLLVLGALAVVFIGQPTTADRWARLEPVKQQELNERKFQIHPGELLSAMHEHKLNLVLLDVRSQADYNLFHLDAARWVDMAGLSNLAGDLLSEPDNSVFVVMSNDETAATEAWKVLVADNVPNVYILEGGINHWISLFGAEGAHITGTKAGPAGNDQLRYEFTAAVGEECEAANPDPEEASHLEFLPKIQLKNRKGAGGGGCG